MSGDFHLAFEKSAEAASDGRRIEFAAINAIAGNCSKRIATGRSRGSRPAQVNCGLRDARLHVSDSLGHGKHANGNSIGICRSTLFRGTRPHYIDERSAWMRSSFRWRDGVNEFQVAVGDVIIYERTRNRVNDAK